MTARPHFVYEAYTEDGEALYVGVTSALGSRFDTHMRSSEWSPQMSVMVVTRYAEKGPAFEAERRRIAALCPSFNTVSNPVAQKSRHEVRQERMAADHATDPDCPYHWNKGCPICTEELNRLIGVPKVIAS